jgi:predicted nuclease of predicted toxin-antitoxin system
MRFLVDAQLPPALARWLVANGHTVEYVADRQMQAASDAAIWDYALQEAAVIIRKTKTLHSARR